MKKLLLIIGVCLSFGSFAQKITSPGIQNVKTVLAAQQDAWNEGRIEDFMQGYWKSDSLKFIGKKGITYGWQQTLDNYKKGYPDKSSMGQLQFDILDMEQFSGNTIYVIGKWTLLREESKGNLGGHFTLVFKKINKRWVIVSDHTS
jgi:hypothetical protein